MKRVAFIVVIVSMFVMVAFTMVSNTIPVLNYAEAKSFKGKLQIIGKPLKEKFKYDEKKQIFSFFLIDKENHEFMVKYKGIKPGNYDQASEITVIGHFDPSDFIIAERLLVKCPSKYEAEGKNDYELLEY